MSKQFNRILLYSNKCQSCSNLIMLMQNMGILHTFTSFCIEDMLARKQPLPPNIQRVPALILPEIQSVFQGKETFEWLEKIRVNSIRLNMLKAQQASGPMGFLKDEMQGSSDNFAYMMTDEAQPKSFLKYGEDDKNAIYTGFESDKITKQEQARLIAEAEARREEQKKHFETTFEQSKQHALMQAQKEKLFAEMMSGKNR